MGKLDGRTAIVTGGANGVGRYYSEALAREGAFITGQTIVVDGGSINI